MNPQPVCPFSPPILATVPIPQSHSQANINTHPTLLLHLEQDGRQRRSLEPRSSRAAATGCARARARPSCSLDIWLAHGGLMGSSNGRNKNRKRETDDVVVEQDKEVGPQEDDHERRGRVR